MKIIGKQESALLDRTEVTALADHLGNKTISNQEAKEALVKELKADENLIVVKHIYTTFGQGYSKVHAYMYKDKKTLDAIEGVKKTKEVKN